MNREFLLNILALYVSIGFLYTLITSDTDAKYPFIYKLKKSKTRLSAFLKIIMFPTVPIAMIVLNILMLIMLLSIIIWLPFIFIGKLFERLFHKIRKVKIIKWLAENIKEE